YMDLPFQGGKLNVYITNPTGSSTKVKVCHHKGNHSAHTISIDPSAVPAHIAHGDKLGDCSGGGLSPQMVLIYSEGIYQGDTSITYVELQPSTFAKYGNFYDQLSAIPATGDVFEGPFHVNDKMKTWGSPEFFGKVTSKKNLIMYGSKDPVFHGGYESGIDVERPFDTTGMRMAGVGGGLVVKDTTGTGKAIDVEIEFKNEKIEYRYKIDDGLNTWSPKKNLKVSDFNGMMFCEKANVYVKGTLDGAATIVASKKGATGYGNVFQTDDIQYKDDVTKKKDSDNMLGLVAENNFRVLYNNDTKHKDILTQASIFASDGDVGPDNALRDNDGKLASWKILGGVIAHDIRATAYYNSSGPYKGYKYVHSYDERFLHTVPPFFPHTKNYEVVSWYE
ncbi:MAG: hypothetical protein R3250_07510, partial [Melioribacteraceae bacterium]|nr:hypothetical protein [Melioribacteraceae bacterium]